MLCRLLIALAVSLGAALSAHAVPRAPHTAQAEAKAYMAAFTTPPTPAFRVAVNNYVYSIKACGSWAKADWRELLFNESAQASLLNLMNPAQSATAVSNPVFTPLSGWTTGAAGYLVSYNPGDGGGSYKYTANDASLIVGVSGSTANEGVFVAGTSVIGVLPKNSPSTNFVVRANTATSAAIGTHASLTGLYGYSKGATNFVSGYVSGVLLGTVASTATGVTNAPIQILTSDSGATLTTKTVTYLYSGGQLTPAEQWCEWRAWSGLVTAMGGTP